ncbi:MAG: sodium:calcium antiporter [Epsilonproteobacteria bacterium]|nr:sodium:calcium antiporter [Campylobacterota bacterium]
MDFALATHLVCVAGGLGVLWWSGDLVVHYSVEVAKAFGLTTFFLGFIVLAMAADVPELAVALTSAFQGVSEVSAGNLIGANFTDIALVIGLTLLLAGRGISVSESDRRKLLLMLSLTAFVLMIGFLVQPLTRVHGAMLIGVYVGLMGWMWKNRHEHDMLDEEVTSITHDVEQHPDTFLKSRWGLVLKLVASLGLVMGVSEIIVYSTTEVASLLMLPLETIGSTILAIGTSLPELSLSLSALRRKEYSLAIGPTLGTVFEQGTLIMGLLALFSGKPVNLAGLHAQFFFMLAAVVVMCIALLRDSKVPRQTGFALISLFVLYFAYHINMA